MEEREKWKIKIREKSRIGKNREKSAKKRQKSKKKAAKTLENNNKRKWGRENGVEWGKQTQNSVYRGRA